MPSKLTVRLWLTCCLLLLATTIFAQQKTVTGKVTDANSQPVAGATVTVKGSNVATQTNVDGVFSIAVPNDKAILVISYVGFEPQELPVGTKTLTISLKSTTSNLNEVVITGYSAQKKKDITGSVAVVNVTNLKTVPSGTTESLLQGQASGVTIINSGQPGGGSAVRIRGLTSVGSTNPLIIIDGTPGSLHDLNVNDIESIQVLKDAGAAAIYGVRGSNGVVVVTTKRGKSGRARVNYDGYYGTQRPLKNGFNLANTLETATAIQNQYLNDGLTPGSKQYGTGATPTIPDYITPTAAKNGDPNTDPSTYKLYSNQITKANKTGTDWFHEIFKPAPIQSHNLSVSGGSDRSTFFFSVGYFDQEGTLIETYLRRYSARMNTTFNVKDHIRVGENAYVFYKSNPQIGNQNEGNAIGMSFRESPIIPIYDIKGNYAGTLSQGLGNAQNPVANMRRTHDNKNNDWQVNGNIFAEADFLKHFTARTSFGGTFDNNYFTSFSYTAYENAENNTNANAFQENATYSSSWTWTNTLRYTNVFAKDHNVNVLVGSEAINNYARGMFSRRGNYYLTNPSNLTVDPSLWTLNFGSPSGQTNGSTVNGVTYPIQSSLYSLFGRVDYSYQEKYIIAGTLRRDGSSIFAPGHQYGYFPSVTGGWRVSREDFMKNVTWLNDLKLRGGWGKLGSLSNTPVTNQFDLFNLSAANSYYDIAGTSTSATTGAYASQLGNSATTWEQDIVTNVGFDATLFNNKFDVSIEWYKKAVSGLLFKLALPASVGGAQPPFINLGNIKNTGIDMTLTYHGSVGKDLRFDVTGVLTSYNNKIVSLPFAYVDENAAGGTRLSSLTRLQVGQPMGEFFGYIKDGIFQSNKDTIGHNQQGEGVGRFIYRDVNKDGKIDANDRAFFGNPNPDFTYGLNIAATYKAFDFSMFLYGSHGAKVINYVRFFTDFPQTFDGAVSKDAYNNSWTPTRTNAKVPMLERSSNFSNNGAFNSYYMENGSYLRCKSLLIGYTLPNTILRRIGVDRLRVYVQAANLFTITKYTGLDPELQNSDLNNNTNFGIDFGNYPANQKNFNIGVNVSF